MNSVIYVEGSKNSKLLGSKPIDGTYAPIESTCSYSCPLRSEKTCYALNSFVGMINRRLEKQTKGLSPRAIARAEAKCIDESYGGGQIPAKRDLRLNISGDSRTIVGTNIIAKAAKRWINRNGQSVFTYTHSWSHVLRKEWGAINVLASIESVKQVKLVHAKGYAPAIVVAEFANDKAFILPNCETVFIPCPAQTREIHCSDCRLCMKSDWLFQTNRGIAFSAHGIKKNDLKRHLTLIK